jgi:hypothetical protein
MLSVAVLIITLLVLDIGSYLFMIRSREKEKRERLIRGINDSQIVAVSTFGDALEEERENILKQITHADDKEETRIATIMFVLKSFVYIGLYLVCDDLSGVFATKIIHCTLSDEIVTQMKENAGEGMHTIFEEVLKQIEEKGDKNIEVMIASCVTELIAKTTNVHDMNEFFTNYRSQMIALEQDLRDNDYLQKMTTTQLQLVFNSQDAKKATVAVFKKKINEMIEN